MMFWALWPSHEATGGERMNTGSMDILGEVFCVCSDLARLVKIKFHKMLVIG